jgi:hypothetical protein
MNPSNKIGANQSPSLDQQLRFAINNRRLIRITYEGTLRMGEPHDYGVQRGIPKLLFYQLRRAGTDNHWRVVTGWRGLVASKIEACEVMVDTFRGSRGSQHEQHQSWDEIFARVK